MTTRISSRGQTVVPAPIRERHHLNSQSRLAWIDEGETIRVIPISAKNPFGRGIAKDLDLTRALLADRAKERKRERSRRRS
jgi:bifunctional DNA-binding transcriptional regulator/antitoxin component of YhaV-PrlF toxin-antitoxin module